MHVIAGVKSVQTRRRSRALQGETAQVRRQKRRLRALIGRRAKDLTEAIKKLRGDIDDEERAFWKRRTLSQETAEWVHHLARTQPGATSAMASGRMWAQVRLSAVRSLLPAGSWRSYPDHSSQLDPGGVTQATPPSWAQEE